MKGRASRPTGPTDQCIFSFPPTTVRESGHVGKDNGSLKAMFVMAASAITSVLDLSNHTWHLLPATSSAVK